MFYAIPMKSICCKYLYYYATRFPFAKFSTNTALPSTTQTDLGNLVLWVPPLPEQRAIADYLDAECGKIDKAAELVAREIQLYRKLKRSLINEVVTGRREVA